MDIFLGFYIVIEWAGLKILLFSVPVSYVTHLTVIAAPDHHLYFIPLIL